MSDVDALYQKLAAGDQSSELTSVERWMLLGRAGKSATSEDIQQRLLGMQVAVSIGQRDGMDVLRKFVKDSDPNVRLKLLELSSQFGTDGLSLVRELLVDPDEKVLLAALQLALEHQDKTSVQKVKVQLHHSNPKIRRMAVILLGQLAGISTFKDLEKLVQDSDPEVRAAAENEVSKINSSKNAVHHVAPQEIPKVVPPPATVPPSPKAEPPSKSPSELTTLAPSPKANSIPAEGGIQEQLLRFAADPNASSPAFEEAQVTPLWSVWRSTRDPKLAVALSKLAATKKWAWTTQLRGLLQDPTPEVRAAAVIALGASAGGVSLFAVVTSLIADPYPIVREAVVQAIMDLNSKNPRASFVREKLSPLKTDPDESVKNTVLAALSKLG